MLVSYDMGIELCQAMDKCGTSPGEEALVTSEVLSNDYRGKTEMSRPGDGFQGDIRRFVSMPNIDFYATHTPVRMISRVLSTTPT